MATKKSQRANPANKQQLAVWKKQGVALRAAELHLRNKEFSHQWAIADWMLAGERAFKRKQAYDEAVKVTGMTRETLQQFAHTAKRVLIRVKGLSFGHHRLVAKFHPEVNRQQKALAYAKTRHFSVAEFDGYLKGMEKDETRQKQTPTNAAALAGTFQVLCQKLRQHTSLQGLLDCHPPEHHVRRQLLDELRNTEEFLHEKAKSLAEIWTHFDAHQERARRKSAVAGAS